MLEKFWTCLSCQWVNATQKARCPNCRTSRGAPQRDVSFIRETGGTGPQALKGAARTWERKRSIPNVQTDVHGVAWG